ncbi:uncharacterized protein LOC142344993 [Convolutriloba macropyga]|uniref:uncharacterized protein LOC142344993 n=1 Tax=Convolutriloba macropyga TaxID=536237 RepID=UPI003F51F7E1
MCSHIFPDSCVSLADPGRNASSRSFLEDSCASINSSFANNSCNQNAFTPPVLGNGANSSHAFVSPPQKQSVSTSDHGFSLDGHSELRSVMSSFTSYTDEKDEGLSTKNLEQRDKELQNYIQMLLNNPGTIGLDVFMRNRTEDNQKDSLTVQTLTAASEPKVAVHANHMVANAPQASREISNQKSQNESTAGSTVSLASTNAAERRITTSSQSTVKTSSKSTTTAKPWK